MALKGALHDEALLIFMDMVNNQIPTFEDKAEALHYFPMWRTWFGLNGLCKIIWNDVVPEDNYATDEPNKIPEHVDNYVKLFQAVTGREIRTLTGSVDEAGLAGVTHAASRLLSERTQQLGFDAKAPPEALGAGPGVEDHVDPGRAEETAVGEQPVLVAAQDHVDPVDGRQVHEEAVAALGLEVVADVQDPLRRHPQCDLPGKAIGGEHGTG